uniref:Uncharacterized protein n=1 Tax=Fagus sylvatica TaxID=28930 RepID=A0A2N9JA20_FAGSY
MPIQKRTINIGAVLGTLAPEPSETSSHPPAPGFSEGEFVMKKRKTREKEVEEAKAKKRKTKGNSPAPWTCEFYVDGRPVNEDDSVWKSKDVRGGQIADAVGRALLLPKDVRAWQGNNTTQMIENLKRDSVVLIETEHLLNESLIENDRLREVERTASARIQEVEGQYKSVEEGLQTAESQLVEISAKLERECDRSSGFQAEIDRLKTELAESRIGLSIQARPRTLKKQLLRGLKDSEAVDELMGHEAVEVSRHQEQVQAEEIQDVEKGVSVKEDNANVDG